MCNTGIESLNFIKVTDGVIDSIRNLGYLNILQISHISNFSKIILEHKQLPLRILVSINNDPIGYSIKLQRKQFFKEDFESYMDLREIRVDGDNEPFAIEQDIIRITEKDQAIPNHHYYPF
jgi:hypothetical protein